MPAGHDHLTGGLTMLIYAGEIHHERSMELHTSTAQLALQPSYVREPSDVQTRSMAPLEEVTAGGRLDPEWLSSGVPLVLQEEAVAHW